MNGVEHEAAPEATGDADDPPSAEQAGAGTADVASAVFSLREGSIIMKLPRFGKIHSARSTVVALGVTALALGMAVPLTIADSASAATPTPVLLGTSSTYAVLAGSGITNTGITTIVGDVGSSPTASETGFAPCPAADCVALTGTNHTDPDPNDTATQNAKVDLTTAYKAAAGQTPTVLATELAGRTLTAGVYNSASGTFGMSGTLVLDGQNDPGSVFIFQTASTLITGSAANVSLINGAQACNVFWQVGSAATLGAGSTLQGTVMAHDNISLGAGVTVYGRVLGGEQASGAGAVTLINDTITSPSTCLASSPTTTTATPSTVAATTTTTGGTAAALKAAEAKAAALKLAKAKAARAKVAKAKAARARVAKAKAARLAAKKAATTNLGHGFAHPTRTPAGFTG